MTIEVYPVKFEACEDNDKIVFTVELFDAASAEVEIKTLVTASSWDEISSKIKECLVAMKLEGDN